MNTAAKTATEIEVLVVECEASQAEYPALVAETRAKASALPVGRERNALLMQATARTDRAQKALERALGERMPEGWTEALEARVNVALAWGAR